MQVRSLDDITLASLAGVSRDTVASARRGRPLTLASATRISRALAKSPIDETLEQLIQD